MRGLLELPQVLREPGNGCTRIEHDLRAIESQLARAFREVSVIADVYANLRVPRLEHRIAEVARPKVELLPESRRAVRDVILPVFAEIRTVGVDDRRGVVIHASG